MLTHEQTSFRGVAKTLTDKISNSQNSTADSVANVHAKVLIYIPCTTNIPVAPRTKNSILFTIVIDIDIGACIFDCDVQICEEVE
jgi:hypothetical protein